MAIAQSAGLVLFRRSPEATGIEVLLGHLGGPFWARRHAGAWSIPKGVAEAGEVPEATARREFVEELGVPVPDGPWLDLGEVRQSKKNVRAWAIEADLDPASITPGEFELEWPRGSGLVERFPELDRVAWFDRQEATEAMVAAQREFLDRLAAVAD